MKIGQIEVNNGILASMIGAIMLYLGIEISVMEYSPEMMVWGLAVLIGTIAYMVVGFVGILYIIWKFVRLEGITGIKLILVILTVSYISTILTWLGLVMIGNYALIQTGKFLMYVHSAEEKPTAQKIS